MAISYSKVNWDTSKYVNPTNMNQMDNGIKAACDGVDTLNTKMGSTSISSIGDGTVTGAISSVNSNRTIYASYVYTYSSPGESPNINNFMTALGEMMADTTTYPFWNSNNVVCVTILYGGTGTACAIINCNGLGYFTALAYSLYFDTYRLEYLAGTWYTKRIALTSETVNLADSVSISLPSGYSVPYQQNKIKLLGSGVAAISFSIQKADSGVLEVSTLGTIEAGHFYQGVLSAAMLNKDNSWIAAPIYVAGNSILLTTLSPSDVKIITAGGTISYT